MYTSANMGLKIWNLLTDLFNHSQLVDNWVAVDTHRHVNGEGQQIPTGGLVDGAVTTPKIATGAVTATQVANSTLTTTQISDTAGIVYGQLARGAGRLAVTSIAGATTAVSGFEYVVTGGAPFVFFLPNPALDAVVAITIGASATGASPITVSALTGTIRGTGLSAATTFLLGSVGATATLRSDGTDWFITDGRQDTGWVSLPNVTSWSNTSGYYVPAARLLGDLVYLRGAVTNGTGNSATYSTTVPTGMHPAATVQGNQINVTAAGTLTSTSTIANSASAFLGGVFYPLI